MLAEALAALTSTGGTALVTAMVTDSWEPIKSRVARLLGRGDARQTEAAQERLELSRAALTTVADADLDRARAEQEIVWRTRLEDLLEAHPQAAIGHPKDPLTWPIWRLLAPHAGYIFASLSVLPESTQDAARSASFAAHHAAVYIAGQGLYAAAESGFRDILTS